MKKTPRKRGRAVRKRPTSCAYFRPIYTKGQFEALAKTGVPWTSAPFESLTSGRVKMIVEDVPLDKAINKESAMEWIRQGRIKYLECTLPDKARVGIYYLPDSQINADMLAAEFQNGQEPNFALVGRLMGHADADICAWFVSRNISYFRAVQAFAAAEKAGVKANDVPSAQ